MTDIFEFWSQMKRGEKIHPADKSIFARIDEKKHGFSTDCLPACYMGRLRTAPVVLLYLSPGFQDKDIEEAKSDKGKDYYLRRWTGNEPNPDIGYSGQEWLESRTKRFADYKIIRERLALLNIGAYHSKNVESYAALMALPSSRVALSWAQNVLFPEAEAGRRVVVCMRSAAYWGLDTGETYGKSLFAPEVGRSGHLLRSKENAKIEDCIKDALQR